MESDVGVTRSAGMSWGEVARFDEVERIFEHMAGSKGSLLSSQRRFFAAQSFISRNSRRAAPH